MGTHDEELELLNDDEAALLRPVSGLYAAAPGPATPLGPAPPGIHPIKREEIRLDVDGRYPQMAVSGTITGKLVTRIHWVARLKKTASNSWAGPIWYKDGAGTSFPYSSVDVTATGGPFAASRTVKIVFKGAGIPKRTVVYKFVSAAFRTVNFEFDFQAGEIADTEIDTAAHPNRPAALPAETLSITKVYERVGCQVTTNAGNPIPAPPGTTWSDMEMHDSMQIHWSRFANNAQWAMWILYASLHESGTNLGGVMFDDIGPNHRQGTALFVDSFIAQPPPGDPNPAAWIDRMRFWTAVHEMGHAFNLAHAWQKSLGTPWVPLANEPEARSFMNYPFLVSGGQAAFFANFEYRFTDQELLFIRHAPERFVQMGNAAWFDHHGFQQDAGESTLRLELRVNREQARYEFMEPVWLELKLTNAGSQPCLVDGDALDADSLTVILKKEGREARQLVPFRQKCMAPDIRALMPGESIYGAVLASAGLNGWDVAEPGGYLIQAAAHIGEEDVISAPLALRIAPPVSREEEYAAGDVFTQETARVLVFNGTRFLDRANDVLHEVVERFPQRRIATHARVALASPLTVDYKRIIPADNGVDHDMEVIPAKPDEAASLIEPALVEQPQTAAETLGHIRYRTVAERLALRLADKGAETEAARTLDSAIDTLSERTIRDRPVRADVIEELRAALSRVKEGERPKIAT